MFNFILIVFYFLEINKIKNLIDLKKISNHLENPLKGKKILIIAR